MSRLENILCCPCMAMHLIELSHDPLSSGYAYDLVPTVQVMMEHDTSLLFDIISILFIGIMTLILGCIRNAVIRLGFQFTHGVNPHHGWCQSMHIFYSIFFLRFKFILYCIVNHKLPSKAGLQEYIVEFIVCEDEVCHHYF